MTRSPTTPRGRGEGRDLVRTLLQQDPELGFSLASAGPRALEGAAESLRESIRARTSGEAWFLLGRVRTEQEKKAEAKEAYRTAVRVKPSLAEAWLNLGSLCYLDGEWKEALEAYEAYLEQSRDDGDTDLRLRVRALADELEKTLGR